MTYSCFHVEEHTHNNYHHGDKVVHSIRKLPYMGIQHVQTSTARQAVDTPMTCAKKAVKKEKIRIRYYIVYSNKDSTLIEV